MIRGRLTDVLSEYDGGRDDRYTVSFCIDGEVFPAYIYAESDVVESIKQQGDRFVEVFCSMEREQVYFIRLPDDDR